MLSGLSGHQPYKWYMNITFMQNPHMREIKLKFKKENDSYIQLPIVEFLLGNNNVCFVIMFLTKCMDTLLVISDA